MARFGARKNKTFRARTQVFMGKKGPRIGLVTPGISRLKRKRSGKTTPIAKMVKP